MAPLNWDTPIHGLDELCSVHLQLSGTLFVLLLAAAAFPRPFGQRLLTFFERLLSGVSFVASK